MSDQMKIDFSLCIIIDQDFIGNRDLKQLTDNVIRGGATMLQYRNKSGSGMQFFTNADCIHQISRSYHIPLIINDRPDIALAIDAEGVHVGQDDIPVETVRQLMGADKLIGLSISHQDQLDQVKEVNYLGVGAVFDTQTKSDSVTGGLNLIRQVRSQCTLPLIGIGGINIHNCESVIQAGADGIAVISAILKSEDPFNAARQIYKKIMQMKESA